jgi:hypothetical protein
VNGRLARSEEARLQNDIAVKGSEVINVCVCVREREINLQTAVEASGGSPRVIDSTCCKVHHVVLHILS